MFKSVSIGFTNSCQFVLVLLLRVFRLLMKLYEIANAASNLVALLYAIWDPDVDSLARDEKALVRPIPANSPMTEP
jgi:hypothetical protein